MPQKGNLARIAGPGELFFAAFGSIAYRICGPTLPAAANRLYPNLRAKLLEAACEPIANF